MAYQGSCRVLGAWHSKAMSVAGWCAVGLLVGCSGHDTTVVGEGGNQSSLGGEGPVAAGASPGATSVAGAGDGAGGTNPAGNGGASSNGGTGSGGSPRQGTGGTPVGNGGMGGVPPTGEVPGCEPATGPLPALQLTPVVAGLAEPTFVTAAPGDDTRLFVLERAGTIRVVIDGTVLAEPFLDLTGRVKSDSSQEEGLLGLAFHPRYAENGRFFVEYVTAPSEMERDLVLAEFVRSAASPDRAEIASERRLIVGAQASNIHQGGMLAFSPMDGLLYVSQGEAGYGRSQDLSYRAGKMLRIDVDTQSGSLPYGIPVGNMTGADVLPEAWSFGWRNPWRFSFDVCTANMYVGDVGESTLEEIDFEPAKVPGRNYGWEIREGSSCIEASPDCARTDLTAPIMEYDHDVGCSVVGGYVYRGQRIPALNGTYIYSDYCSGEFFSFRVEAGLAVNAQDITADLNPGHIRLISSFGVDNGGEVYVVSLNGAIYRIDPE